MALFKRKKNARKVARKTKRKKSNRGLKKVFKKMGKAGRKLVKSTGRLLGNKAVQGLIVKGLSMVPIVGGAASAVVSTGFNAYNKSQELKGKNGSERIFGSAPDQLDTPTPFSSSTAAGISAAMGFDDQSPAVNNVPPIPDIPQGQFNTPTVSYSNNPQPQIGNGRYWTTPRGKKFIMGGM